jgi:CRP-like cAMP-binding protein
MARIELFNHAADWVGFGAGKTIFREGEPGEHMYVVVEGEVEIAAAGRVLEIARPGSVVGELALTAARLVPVDAKRFQFMIQQTPFFALQVMSIMAERLRRWTAPIPPAPR